jgi:acetolactate synthase-1/2/3 large subunit
MLASHSQPILQSAKELFIMATVDGGTLVGRVLQEQKVQYLFAINGGHTFPILANLTNHGIKLIHMRHEQATAYAADAWARTTGRPGVCCVTAGCGLTNAITGLCMAGLTNSAVVCLSGQHPTLEDGIGSFQEAYGSDICRTFAKYTKRVLDWPRIMVDLRQAFREAMSPPQGVALVEFPANILYQQAEEKTQFPGAKVYEPDELRSQGDPRAVERAIELLARAEKPLLVGGDGIFWSWAPEELTELAKLTHTPVYTRRAGQGALAEDHPLAVRGAWKKPFTGGADVVIAVGFRYWSGEKFGQPPTWSAKAKYVQIDSTAIRIGSHVPADVPIVGDPKLVLRQLIEKARERKADFDRKANSAWLQEVAKARTEFDRSIREREEKVHGSVPIHPDRLARDLVSVLDPSTTVVIDSFTLSGYMSHWFPARFPGQVVDAGPLAPVGHSIGMAIGVQLARPSRPVVTVIGDGGMGIGGWDMETAAKYKLPVVAVLWNNSSWGPSFDQMPLLKGRTEPFDMLPNIRYDRIFAELGCHGEHVEKPDDLRPALERALKAGKPAVVNVIGDKRIGHPNLGGNLLGSTQL